MESEEGRREALRDFDEDIQAMSSKTAAASWWKTWREFHASWHANTPEEHKPLPLTVSHIRCVASLFKKGGYRSFPNYMSKAHDMHVEAGFEWSDQLARAQRRACRSVRRGQGPARQSTPLPLEETVQHDFPDETGISGGPLCPLQVFVISTFFMLRELEASLALARSLTFDYELKEITLHLPVSKTDPYALGCHRTWGCICGGEPQTPCAYHAALKLFEVLKERFGAEGALPVDLPLFPTPQGRTMTKAKFIQNIEYLVCNQGLRLTGERGNRLFGGHSARVTGAQFLAGVGLDIFLIQLLARWASQVVLRYVREAPLKNLTRTTVERLRGTRADSGPPVPSNSKGLEQRLKKLEHSLTALKRWGAQHVQDEEAQAAWIRETGGRTPEGKAFIVNLDSGKVHKVLLVGAEYPPAKWQTKCGWKFATLPHKLIPKPPFNSKLFCEKCRGKKPDSDSEVTESASSSGNSQSSESGGF